MKVEAYLKENIDNQIIIKAWEDERKIPIFLKRLYKFHEMKILGNLCILIEVIDQAPGIDTIKKHINRIEKITNHQIVLYYKKITRYRRKSLIENNIPFIIEDGQIFLPFLGMHLKKMEDSVQKEMKKFTPSAQIAYLYFFYNKETVLNATDFSKIFGWTLMTASRALNDLYTAKLLTYEIRGKTGRSKEYTRIFGPDYFKIGSVLLNSPVKRVVYVKTPPKKSYVAGLEALADLSMLNPPNYKVRAIYEEYFVSEDLETIANEDIINDERLVELQIWGYDPKLFTKKDIVDRVSLYASLKEENDERIEQALEEALGGGTWYTD